MDAALLNDSETRIELLSSIAEDLEASEQAKLVFAVPKTSSEFKKLQKTDFRYVVWGRLYSLGYAKFSSLKARKRPGKNNKIISTNIQYKEAVEAFQKDAGTVKDGWVGLQTWESMQELFTFEQDANLDKWFQPQYQDILYRATHLRLMMLGLVDKPDGRNSASGNHEDVQAGLSLWRTILRKLAPDKFNSDTDENTLIEWLFDIDRLTRLVSANFGELRALAANPYMAPNFGGNESLRFQKSLLKIELWLYGVKDIEPGNRGAMLKVAYIPENMRGRTSVNVLMIKVSELIDELNVSLNGISTDNESQVIERILQHLASLNDEDVQQATAVMQANMLNKRLAELPAPQQKQVLKTMKNKEHSLGAWLFDGAKRVLRWLKKTILGAIDWFKQKARVVKRIIDQLATGAKRLATDAYNFVKRGFQVLADGFTFLATPTYLADNDEVIVHKKADMDTVVVVSHTADEPGVRAFWNRIEVLRLRARAAIELASVIIEEAISIIKKAVFIGPLAIVSLLLAIYKMRNSEVFSILKQAYATY